MSDENFNDIPELGPAGDDDDRRRDIPTLNKPAPPRPPATPPAKGVRFVTYSMLVLFLLTGAFAFWSYSEQVRHQQALARTSQLLASMQARVNGLEQLVSDTDSSASQSGAALQAQLRKMAKDNQERIDHEDDQIRKLWAVYQKYKPQIENLDKELKAATGTLATHSKTLTSTESELKQLSTQLKTTQSSLQDELKSTQLALQTTETAQTSLSERLRNQELSSQEIADLQAAQIADLKKSLDKLGASQQTIADVQAQLREHGKRLESIDTSRRQINEELLLLEKRIARLQTSIPATVGP